MVVREEILWYEGIVKGDEKAVDPLMEQLLGRQPRVVTEILTVDPIDAWHQNYANEIDTIKCPDRNTKQGKNSAIHWSVREFPRSIAEESWGINR